jgi:hypothetical protein
MKERNKTRESFKASNNSKESEQVKTAESERENNSKKSFGYNNDNCEQTQQRSRGRPPLKEVKNEKSNENSNVNSFSLDFLLDSMLLM